MKTKLNHQLVAAVGLLFTLALQPSTLLAQGSLTPPGPPAPTMKTLQQVEPRVPISSAPFTITQPGSYYLTTNLTVSGGDAITITTNDVTLDLNGFTISSTTNPASGTAVLINAGLRDITIQNGHIRGGVTNNGSGFFSGPGFGSGIASPGVVYNVRVSGVLVSGCGANGIDMGNNSQSTTVENCVVRTVGSQGIVASTIRGCAALDCGWTAIYGQQVSDSRGECVAGGVGIYAETAQNCYGFSSLSVAVEARTALNCYGLTVNGTGISAVTAQNCYGYSTGAGTGLGAGEAQNCRGRSESGTGLDAETAQNCHGDSELGPWGLRAVHAIGCIGQNSGGIGLRANTALNCSGESNVNSGLYAERIAIGCYGYTQNGPRGLYARIANTCVGYHYTGGVAIEATIANSCWAQFGTLLITNKYNMP
jgi:hypothetical protein